MSEKTGKKEKIHKIDYIVNTDIERRYYKTTEFRFNSKKNELEGQAAKFEVWSEDLGGFREKIRAGNFKRTIANGDIRGLFNHDPNYVLARTKSKTLSLWEDETALNYLMKLGSRSYDVDLRESIERGDISQNSFGFRVVKQEWNEDYTKRTLIESMLSDVGPVTFPAYEQTTLKLRSLRSTLKEKGINYNAINLIIGKNTRGKEITDDDVEILTNTISILRSIMPKETQTADPGSSHSAINEEDIVDYSTLSRIVQMRHKIKRFYGGFYGKDSGA